MSKVYVCRECGYAFPDELTHLIESNIQVYCERCGSPFILEGVTFKPAPTPYIRKKKPYRVISERKLSSLEDVIQFLNKISFIPLFIFTFISFGLIAEIFIYWDIWILFERTSQGLMGLFLLIYDKVYISHKVKEKKYDEILLDSFGWGILGCILYGLGVLILIKGVFIIIYNIIDSKNKGLKIYDVGLLVKNSLNYFSAIAGFLIILFGIYRIFSDRIYFPRFGEKILYLPFGIEIHLIYVIYFIFLIIALSVLFIDIKSKNEISKKQEFKISDSLKFFITGIFGLLFYAAGIFILLKGVLIFFLFLGKPKEKAQEVSLISKPAEYTPTPIDIKREPPEKIFLEEKEIEIKPVEKPIITQAPIIPEVVKIEREQEKIEEITKKPVEEIPLKIDIEEREKREVKYELKLHESLLPVKDEKDKKLVKEYFSKIFALLSKDLRKQILDLKISKKEKKELLEELAFLTKEEQVKYIDAIVSLYREIPKKLINRIRKLPNVKPKHYDKIIEQLKYMNVEEQIKFVQFLEENF